jgi:hypothetical protein
MTTMGGLEGRRAHDAVCGVVRGGSVDAPAGQTRKRSAWCSALVRTRLSRDSRSRHSLAQDVVGGAPIDTVSFHHDDDQKIADIARAITALEAACEARAAGQR